MVEVVQTFLVFAPLLGRVDLASAQRLHVAPELGSRERAIAGESDLANLRLWTVVDHEGQLRTTRAAGLQLARDAGRGPSGIGQHLTQDRLHLRRAGRIVEGVEPQLGLVALEPALDGRLGECLAPAVVDRDQPRPLTHREGDDLAVLGLARVQPHVVEETGVQQAAEIAAQARRVVAVARFGRHVVEQRGGRKGGIAFDLHGLDNRGFRSRRRGDAWRPREPLSLGPGSRRPGTTREPRETVRS